MYTLNKQILKGENVSVILQMFLYTFDTSMCFSHTKSDTTFELIHRKQCETASSTMYTQYPCKSCQLSKESFLYHPIKICMVEDGYNKGSLPSNFSETFNKDISVEISFLGKVLVATLLLRLLWMFINFS